jgi:hypothetical protein
MIKKSLGFIILLAGLILILYTGLGFRSKEEVIDMGSFHITRINEKLTNWYPLIGLGAMFFGGVLFVSGIERRSRINSD